MASRFEKFSERARRVLTIAQEEARSLNHSYIGTEHILLGLVREEAGVAARVLTNLGIGLSKVRSAVEFIIGRGDKPGTPGQEQEREAQEDGYPDGLRGMIILLLHGRNDRVVAAENIPDRK